MTNSNTAEVDAPLRAPAPRDAAIIAAIATFGMGVAGIFANGTVLSLVGADAATTGALLIDNMLMLRFAIVAFLVVAVLDVVLAWAIARYFGRAHRDLAMLAGWLRLAYGAVLVTAVGHLSTAVRVTTEGGPNSDIEAHAAMADFTATWQLGLVVFASHLAVLAVLLVRDSGTPTWLGIIIGLAAIAYAVDGIGNVLLPSDSAVLDVLGLAVALPSIVGEFGLAIWLLARGGRVR